MEKLIVEVTAIQRKLNIKESFAKVLESKLSEDADKAEKIQFVERLSK